MKAPNTPNLAPAGNGSNRQPSAPSHFRVGMPQVDHCAVHIAAGRSAQNRSVSPPRNSRRPAMMTARQDRNDRQALESLLLLVFFALTNLSVDAPKAVHDAFEQITVILRRYVASILESKRVPNRWSLAEDIVQELWVRFLTLDLARRFDEQRSHQRAPYLFGVLRKVLLEAVRKLNRGSMDSLPEDLADGGSDPAELAAMREMRSQVSAAIGRLRPALAVAIRERYFADEQSPDFCDLTANTRHGRVFRGMRALRRQLQDPHGH